MSSGKMHDRSILFSIVPVTIASFYYLPNLLHLAVAPFISVTSFAIGGFWLSPDIDLKQSYPSQRLGMLSFLWKPYRQLSGHRGFSHIPAIGTLSRMLYITLPVIVWAVFAKYDLTNFVVNNKEILAAIFIGLEASTIVHLLMDYVPFLNKH